ncbi:glycosyltransferase family 39 protein [Pyruvatibacter sp. HU-CL02332]|uniref:ArnT family glycosyltransferase n=1 Tax=Pyruvatibacter sp. HU-CL02332 TaxID=3127650 RepID=UPI00310697FF
MPFFNAVEKRPVTALLLLCLALYLPGLFTLPALDRDEARFAQATVQMHETGDYMVPHFQEDLRAKKPVAIYWAQAVTSGAASLVGLDDPNGHPGIWAFRIPSLIAAILVVLLTWRVASLFYGRRAGLMAGALIATTVVLVAEANIAKTDAALAASIMAAQLALARVWLARDPTRFDPGLGNAVLFWVAMSIGILLKGPIAPMISGLTMVGLVVATREIKWIFLLRPIRGGVLLLLLTLPWAVSVWLSTNGAFFGEAVGGDFLPKLAGGQESHGAPFGYYTLLLLVTFFPANLLLMPAIARAWGERQSAPVMFLAAWIIPNWLVYEIVPTKLPHYVLPVYPALAILVAALLAASLKNPQLLKTKLARANIVAWALVALVLAAAIVALPVLLPEGTAVEPGPWPVVGAGIFAAMAVQVLAQAWRARASGVVLAVAVTGIAFSVALLEFARPRVDPLWLADRTAQAMEDRDLVGMRVVSAGFSEPSLVFALGTKTRLTNGTAAANALAVGEADIALVEEREAATFFEEATRLGITPVPALTVDGLNYSRGDAVSLTAYLLTTR